MEPVRFPFDETKAVAALTLILQRSNRSRSKGELVKLLYLADRAMILKRGSPITGDIFCALPHGMIVSKTLSLIDQMILGQPSELFERNFNVVGKWDLELRAVPDTGALSRSEIRVLDAVFEEHGNKSFSALRELTHSLPEYSDPAESSIPVAPETILAKERRPEEEIDKLRTKAAQFTQSDELFNRIKE